MLKVSCPLCLDRIAEECGVIAQPAFEVGLLMQQISLAEMFFVMRSRLQSLA